MKEPMSFGQLLALGVVVMAIAIAYAAFEFRGCDGRCPAGMRLSVTEYDGCVCVVEPSR